MGDQSKRLASMLGRGVVLAVNAARKLQSLQLRLLADESKDAVEHFEPFGFTSHPLPGAEHVTLFLDGDRSHGVTVVVADRRYRLTGLPAGGVAIFDSEGTSVVLSADGVAKVTASARVEIDAPITKVLHDLDVGGNIVAAGNISDQAGAKSMADMRATYNVHDHPLPGGGTSGDPNQQQ